MWSKADGKTVWEPIFLWFSDFNTKHCQAYPRKVVASKVTEIWVTEVFAHSLYFLIVAHCVHWLKVLFWREKQWNQKIIILIILKRSCKSLTWSYCNKRNNNAAMICSSSHQHEHLCAFCLTCVCGNKLLVWTVLFSLALCLWHRKWEKPVFPAVNNYNYFALAAVHSSWTRRVTLPT